VTGNVGLRRFVPGAAAAPAAAPGTQDELSSPGMAEAPGERGQRWAAAGGCPATGKCELCATEVPAEHGHVADLEQVDAHLRLPGRATCSSRMLRRARAGTARFPIAYLRDPARELSVSGVG